MTRLVCLAVGLLYLGDTNINLWMIETGNAWWYQYYAPHERQFEQAEKAAVNGKLGLWDSESPIPPWQWRRGRR